MARPKEFDPTEALGQALGLFWRQGYTATSLDDLLQATGLSKSSLYQSFGSKAALFAAALDRYQADQLSKVREALGGGADARSAIGLLLRSLVLPASDPSAAWGCLTCNSAIELAPGDPAVAASIARHYAALEDLLAKTLERGQAEGSIGSRHSPIDLARFLIMALNGLQVLVRARSDPARLEQAISVVLTALD